MDETTEPELEASPWWLIMRLDARWRARPRRGLVEKLLAQFPCLPPDYISLIRLSNGASIEGINIWDIEFAIKFNDGRDEDEAGGAFVFASEGEQRYGFDLRRGCKMAVVDVSARVEWQYALYVAPTFSEMLRLAKLRWEWMEADLEAEDVIDQAPAFVASVPGSSTAADQRNAFSPNGGLLASLKRLFSRPRF